MQPVAYTKCEGDNHEHGSIYVARNDVGKGNGELSAGTYIKVRYRQHYRIQAQAQEEAFQWVHRSVTTGQAGYYSQRESSIESVLLSDRKTPTRTGGQPVFIIELGWIKVEEGEILEKRT